MVATEPIDLIGDALGAGDGREVACEPEEQKRAALMTFVIVGAGATGVELAGTIAELTRATLPADFRNIDTRKARIALIEAGPRVLAGFADDLSDYARRSLEPSSVTQTVWVRPCHSPGSCGPARSPQP